MRPTIYLSTAALLAGAAMRPVAAQSPSQSPSRTERSVERQYTVTVNPDGSVFSWDSRDDASRAWLGITTGESGARDSLGLVVLRVVPGSPAEKAGLEEGMRLTSVNGTSLRLAAADADDPAMRGVLQRRLTRALRDVKPGADVTLGVLADGAARSLTVKTIAAADAPETEGGSRQRAVLGVSLGGQPSRRDTAGVFVSAVSPDGPAEKAGLVEGDRIAAINGQDLRVPRDDAGDAGAAQARVARLTRVLRGVTVGDEVELRVQSGGRTRTLKVKTARASELGDAGEFRFVPGLDDIKMPLLAPMPPRPPRVRFFDDDGGRLRVNVSRGRMTI